MFDNSQPLDPTKYPKLKLTDQSRDFKTIKSQWVGKMFDNLFSDNDKRRIDLKTRLRWKWQEFKGFCADLKYVIRNHWYWHKTMSQIRPWEGFDGIFCVVQVHLHDYIRTEQKYGHAEKEYKQKKIATATETLKILARLKDHHQYLDRRRKAVEEKYPKYKSLITRYAAGGSSSSGDFVAYGKGWVGKEAGKNPREGYFEFVDGRFKKVKSPNQTETDKLIAQIEQYYLDIQKAYKLAEADLNRDFERLGLLLKENIYTWWD